MKFFLAFAFTSCGLFSNQGEDIRGNYRERN
jgi:hypothetical protein